MGRIFAAFPGIHRRIRRLPVDGLGWTATAGTRLDGAADEPATDRSRPRRRAIEVLVVGLVPQHPLAAMLGADIALPVGDGIGHRRTLASDLACLREWPELGLSRRIQHGLALTLLRIRLGGITIPRGLRACTQRQRSRHQRHDSASPQYGFWSHRHHSPYMDSKSSLLITTRRTQQHDTLCGPHATHSSLSLTALASPK